jgi:small conductance mechanosensitive channel
MDQFLTWGENLFTTEIYGGKSLSDYFTLDTLIGLVGSTLAAVFILFIGFTIAGFVSRRIHRIGQDHISLDDTLFSFLGNIARYVVLAFTFLFVLNTFGVQTTSVIALIGAAGLAVGLALQGTLSNLAAGIMIILFRPLKIGDFVEVNGTTGTVKDITLNYTEIADLSNVKVTVPNSEVWGNKIKNYSVYPTRRAEWTFGVGYGANLSDAETVIRDTIMADARSHNEPDPFIQVNALNSSSVDFLVRVWCDADVYFQYQADMKRKVKEALDQANINIPFPTRTLVHEQPMLEVVQDDDGAGAAHRAAE